MLKYFPTFDYNFGSTGGIKTITNLFKNININIDDEELVSTQDINASERPEQLSYRLYENFDYFWVLLLLNNIKNPFNWNKILGQNNTNNDLDTYDAKILQFYNASPFLPSKQESGITYQGVAFNLYEDSIIDSYDGIDLSGILPGDTVTYEKGLGAYGINCFGAGQIPESTVAKNIHRSSKDIEDYYHYGQSIVPLAFDTQKDVIQLTAGKDFTCALDKYGQIHCWGREDTLSQFNTTSWELVNLNYIKSIRTLYKFIEASERKLVAINASDTLEFFGVFTTEESLYTGVTGSKTSWYHVTDSGSPGGVLLKGSGVLVDFGTAAITGVTYTDIACGSQFCVGVMSNGGLTAWGQNNYSQLIIPGGTGFVEVSATYNHSLARKIDGTVYAWGLSADGQTTVPNLKYKSIAAGKKHSAALTTSNQVISWGKIPRAGFSGANITGITVSDYTLNQYKIYGGYDLIYSGDNHVVVRGISGQYRRFTGKVESVDNDYKRLYCKYYGGVLSADELSITDPTGTIVTITRNISPTEQVEIKQINNSLVAIQNLNNAVIEIKDGYDIIPITKQIWKTIFIINLNTVESDPRLVTLNKKYRDYNFKIKQNLYYVDPRLLQRIDSRISDDLSFGNSTNYNISDFT